MKPGIPHNQGAATRQAARREYVQAIAKLDQIAAAQQEAIDSMTAHRDRLLDCVGEQERLIGLGRDNLSAIRLSTAELQKKLATYAEGGAS